MQEGDKQNINLEEQFFETGGGEVTIKTEDEVQIPVSYEYAEEALLGMFIQDDDIAALIVQSNLMDKHFLKRKNRIIFPAILNLRFDKGICNHTLLADYLEKESMPDGQSKLDFVGGLQEISRIIACAPPTMDLKVAQGYIDIILEQYRLAKIKEAVHWISAQRKFDEYKIVEKVSDIQRVLSDNTTGKYGLTSLDILLNDAYVRFKDRKTNPEKYKGIKTGFYWLDKCRVVSKKRVCIIGAKTSFGKSIFVTNIISEMVLNGNKVLLFTPELDKEEYVDRLICSSAMVDIDDWKNGATGEDDFKVWGEKQKEFMANAHNLYIEDKGSQSCSFILSSIKKHMLNHPVDVVVIDYLQKLNYYGDNTKKAITDMMERFCSFAKDNDIAFIVVSQLRRTDKAEPDISDLKESGDIENFADKIVLLHRNSTTDISESKKGWYKVAKNRQGPTTEKVELKFDINCLRFSQVDVPSDEDGEDFERLVADEDQPDEQSVM